MLMGRKQYMKEAILKAKYAFDMGEVPVGAIVVDSKTNEIIAKSGNIVEISNNPTAHAEIIALQKACDIKQSPRIPECDLYVTLEPCPMCATAISFARIRRLYFGAYDPKGGGIEHGAKIFEQSTCHHKPEIYGGINEQECSYILKDFFKNKR